MGPESGVAPGSPAGALHDLVVIGAGPGGYVAAIRAAQLGLQVVCVERWATLGGTCLNVGCIPSKALLESSEHYAEAQHGLAQHGVRIAGVTLDLDAMLARKDAVVRGLADGVAGLFAKHKVRRMRGTARLLRPAEGGSELRHRVEVTAADGAVQVIEARRVLVATGSAPAALPGVPFDGERVVTSTEALSFREVPRHLVVIGAGVIGLELGSVWRRLGAQVTVLEYLPRILAGVDAETATQAQRILARQGLDFRLGCRVLGAQRRPGAGPGGEEIVEVSYRDAEGRDQTVSGDRVLVAIGRVPYTAGLGAEEAGLQLERGRIVVDEHLRTHVPGIYAIGDVIRGPMLAHKAEEEGIAAVEHMVTGAGHVNYDAIPNIVYTWPEIASVGRSEEELREAGVAYRVGKFPFLANGRARTMAYTEGSVKLLADARTDRLLGAHIIGPRAGDLIAELAVAMELGASAEDVARSVHAHPTLAEVIKEAALAVDGRQLHM